MYLEKRSLLDFPVSPEANWTVTVLYAPSSKVYYSPVAYVLEQ